MKVLKAVIPVAGLGTRFLPATKTVPKELLPIVDKPTLLYNVEELVGAGVRELILVTGRGKSAIEDFFDVSYEVEDILAKSGKDEVLRSLRELREKLTIVSVRQHHALGLGHAVLCAERLVGDDPFAVLLGDEIMLSEPGQPTATGELTELAEQHNKSAVAVIEVAPSETNKYGIVKATSIKENIWTVSGVVEKPAIGTAPSCLALPGRYVFKPDIFKYLHETKPGRLGEIQLSDAMNALAESGGLIATKLRARRFDAGDKLGFLTANVELALNHPEIGGPFRQYLESRFGKSTP